MSLKVLINFTSFCTADTKQRYVLLYLYEFYDEEKNEYNLFK